MQVLAQGLHVVQEGEREATVGYMQSLSAVVKTVGRGCLMGLKHPRPCFLPRRETQCETGPSMLAMSTSHPAPSCHEVQDEKVFRVNGIHSSTRFDQSSMSELVVDRRSARWMLEYLSASCDGDAYPSSSNIYGTAWKVSHPLLLSVDFRCCFAAINTHTHTHTHTKTHTTHTHTLEPHTSR